MPALEKARSLIHKAFGRQGLKNQIMGVLAVFTVMIVVSWVFMDINVRRHMSREAGDVFDFAQEKIETVLAEPRYTLGVFSQVVSLMIADGAQAGELRRYFSGVRGFMLTDEYRGSRVDSIYGYFDGLPGGPLFISGTGWAPPEGYDPARRPWYTAAAEAGGNTVMTDPYIDTETGKRVMTYARRIFGGGEPLGVVALNVELGQVSGAIVDTKLGGSGYGLLLSGTLEVIAHPDAGLVGTNLRDISPHAENIADELGHGESVSAQTMRSYNGVLSLAFFRRLENGWYMGVLTPYEEYDAEVKGLAFIFCILGSVMAGGVCLLLISISDEKERSERENRQKSGFLARMSHEIRTPMNAILGIAEIQLRNKDLPPGTGEALGRIYSSGSVLLNIINEILDLSKIEAGKLELAPVVYEVASLVADAVNLNLLRAESKGLKLSVDVDGRTPARLFGDDLRIKQIMNNLLSNAIKYTERGEVWLELFTESAETGVNLIIRVSDTGQGMAPEQISTLFDEYSRLNTERNRSTEGTGLGMSITRQMIDLMKGEISVNSSPGEGTLFTVRLPQGLAGGGALGHKAAERLRQMNFGDASWGGGDKKPAEKMPYGRVLVVDDVETNLYVARGYLQAYGLTIDTAMSGAEAIEKIRRGGIYDVVFMDHMMPQMDGVEAVKTLRGTGYARPIVALTANALAGQAEMFLGNGFDGFISKPIDVRELEASLVRFVKNRRREEADRQGGSEARGEAVARGEAAVGASAIDENMARLMSKDAAKAIEVFEEMSADRGWCGTDGLNLYTVKVHAMKTLLALAGESALSDTARLLEQEARAGNTALLERETPEFIKNLRAVMERIRPADEAGGFADEDEDKALLREKMGEIAEACAVFDKKPAKAALAALDGKVWSRETREMLDALAQNLLHGDFEEAEEKARGIGEGVER